MKTSSYNPSIIEVKVANALASLKDALENQLEGFTITDIVTRTQKDNPDVTIHLKDADGDAHEVVINIIQIPDRVN